MRIVGGTARGTALAALGRGDPAARLRPTTDRVRESLFNVLTQGRHGDLVTGARILDLFAGTGALSLEALSRGAAHATLVENGRAAQALIRANLAKLRDGGPRPPAARRRPPPAPRAGARHPDLPRSALTGGGSAARPWHRRTEALGSPPAP